MRPIAIPAFQRRVGCGAAKYRRRQAIAARFALCALIVWPCSLNAADTLVPTLEVRDVTATVMDASDREYVTLDVRFGATLQNRTGLDLQVAASPILPNSVDRLVSPEKWELLLTSSSYLTSETKVEDCRAVEPSQKFEFPRILADAILKKADVRPRSRIVLRFHLSAVCRHRSEVLFQPLVTGPVEVEVPRW